MTKGNKKETPVKTKEAYAALGLVRGQYYLAVSVQKKIRTQHLAADIIKKPDKIFDWLKKFSNENDIKFIAIALVGVEQSEKLGEKLWLKLDIVPHIFKNIKLKKAADLNVTCYRVLGDYNHNNQVRVKMASRRRVTSSFLTSLHAYKKFATSKEWSSILGLAEEFKKKKLRMIYINATAAGGGVAHMRHAMMRFYRLLGVDVKWYVLKPDLELFNITKKKFHNVLQSVAPADCVLTHQEKNLYLMRMKENSDLFRTIFARSNVVVIDDPQPTGLIPHIKRLNPRARIIYRSHIQVRSDLIKKRARQQFNTWKFLWQFIKFSDFFISQPMPEFVPASVKKNKLVYMPPSTDPLDGLNKKLSQEQKNYYLRLFQEHLSDTGQAPLDMKRPYLIQIARFDPSKGIYDVIESYRKLCRRLLKADIVPRKMPQLVIVGNGSIDDPEGVSIYEEVRHILKLDTYAHIASNIKIARLQHNDQLLNTLMDNSLIALQLSHREGFESRVTEALMKGKPVIAYKAGGIPLQIKHGQTGFLTKVGKTSQVADYAKKLFLDKNYYKKISRQASTGINHDYWTLNNSAKWLFLALETMKQSKRDAPISISDWVK